MSLCIWNSCNFRVRLDMNESNWGFCSPNGRLLLEMVDDDAKADELIAKLNAVEGVEAKKMTFDHP